jgi:capsular polysaccharide biosynthesis protein
MTEQPADRHEASDMDAVDLAIVVAALRKYWVIVLGCAIAGLLIGVVQLRSARPVYQAEMTVGAVQHSAYDARQTMAAAHAAFRDAAARQSSTNAMEFALYVQSLTSRRVADALAGNPEIVKMLAEWEGGRGPPARADPAPGAHVYRFLIDHIAISQDQQKHVFAAVRLSAARPESAVRFLGLLHKATDDLLRQDALLRSRQMIAGLNAFPNAQTDPAMIEARGEQQVTEAAALSEAPFAAQLVDPPAVLPDRISSPLRTLAAGLFLGLIGGMALALLLAWLGAWRKRRRDSAGRSA